MTWRLLSTPPLDGAANMAVDVWLMERARVTGETVLRAYQWRHPTVSFGRNQRAAGGYDRARIAGRGVDVVRRPTGGRAILHWRELTYSVTRPMTGLATLTEDYVRINAILIDALRRVGAHAEPMQVGVARRPGLHPCFAEPSTGEIVVRDGVDAAKLVGSAQYREDGALLQHGSILLHDDQPLLLELSDEPVAPTHAACLTELLGRPVAPVEVESALFESVRCTVDPDATELDFASIRQAARQREATFRDPLWTWRR